MGREPDGSMAGRLLVTGQGGKGATGWSSVTKMRLEEAPQALLCGVSNWERRESSLDLV